MHKPLPFAHPLSLAPAMWHPKAERTNWTRVLFRRSFTLDAPSAPVLWFSGSMRVELFLDGTLIARGPSRSDPMRWGARRVACPTMHAGTHVLSARVTYFADSAGLAQMGPPAFFALASDDPVLHPLVVSGADWQCWHDRASGPAQRHGWLAKRPHQVTGDGESFDAQHFPWAWLDAVQSGDAPTLLPPASCEWGNLPLGCRLFIDDLPAMEEIPHPWARSISHGEALLRGEALHMAPHQELRVILDAGGQVNAYPSVHWSGGAGATIDAVWSEAPWRDDHSMAKAPRDQAEGHLMRGPLDAIRCDGGEGRSWTPAWFRSFRYAQLTIRTQDAALRLDRLLLLSCGFPLQRRALVQVHGAQAQRWQRLDAACWTTLRLCAHELMFDCPHYEQCQFPGDSRVQAWAHALLAGESRLSGKAIDDLAASRMSDGMIQCRWPSRADQVIPTFGLAWIGMLHDRRVVCGDRERIARHLHTARGILDWFLSRRRSDGLLGHIAHAPFVDWCGFDKGNAPQQSDGGSSILSSLCAEACAWMVELERFAGSNELGARWRQCASELAQAVLKHCWDDQRGLIADTSLRQGSTASTFSIHAQVQAILAGVLPQSVAHKTLLRALDDTTIRPAIRQCGTHFYRYHVARALIRVGAAQRVHAMMESFAANLDHHHLDTLPESDGDPRSDCHAWSVLPAIAQIEVVLGVRPDPAHDGFSQAIIDPHPGELSAASGSVPTPHGEVHIAWQRSEHDLELTLTTPIAVQVRGHAAPFAAGQHRLRVPFHDASG